MLSMQGIHNMSISMTLLHVLGPVYNNNNDSNNSFNNNSNAFQLMMS